MRRARLYVGLLVLCGCAEAPSAPVASEWTVQADFHYVGKSPYTFAAITQVSDCGVPVYTHEVVYDGCRITIGQTKYIGLQVNYSPAFEEAFSALRSPGQMSFVVVDVDGDPDTIPAPPSPGPARSAWARGGEASLTNLLSLAGLSLSDTIPGPPAPFRFRNSGTAMLVLSVDELVKKRVLKASPNEMTLEVIWKLKTPGGMTNFAIAAALPPSDTIPSRGGGDCETRVGC